MLIKRDPMQRRGLTPVLVEQLVLMARLAANTAATFDGRQMPDRRCVHDVRHAGLRLIYTRDEGMHSSGWFKNPQFERCLHLSISFRDPTYPVGGDPPPAEPFDWYVADRLVESFFGEHRRKAWHEGPKSREGKYRGVEHWRVFTDPAWVPIMPAGEVYSRDLTEAGWRSWSEIHGQPPSAEPSILHAG